MRESEARKCSCYFVTVKISEISKGPSRIDSHRLVSLISIIEDYELESEV